MPFELTCSWLPEDRCDQQAVGMAEHPVQGVIPVCGRCIANFDIPLIQKPQPHLLESE